MFDVAIIGNGATAIATLKALNFLSIRHNINFAIGLVGRISNMGFGVAYNEANDYAIMNTPVSNISIDSEDSMSFVKWARNKGLYYLGDNAIPRRIYGNYLYDMAMELHDKKRVTFIDSMACDIDCGDDGYEIIMQNESRVRTKYLILCTGNDSSKWNDFYGLTGHAKFIYNPYPLYVQLSKLKESEDTLILGSGLTAVDIAVALYWKNHQGKIIICSREGRLPSVKANAKLYIPRWCRFDHFLQIFNKQNRKLSLRQIFRLVRRELRTVNANWIDIFFSKGFETADSFSEKIYQAQKGLPWLDVLIGIQHEVDKSWAYVNSRHKEIFIKSYLSSVLKAIAPMPLINANILNKLLSENRLEIMGGIRSIDDNGKGFDINCIENVSFKVDNIINASGFNREISYNSGTFITNLLNKKIIHPHPSGGIKVCAETGRVFPNQNIFAVGHLTMGEHPLINNIELIVINAKETALALVKELMEMNPITIHKTAYAL